MDDYVGGKKIAGTILNYYDDDDDGVFPSQRDMWTSKWGKGGCCHGAGEAAAGVGWGGVGDSLGESGRERGDWCNSLKEGSRTSSLDTA